MLLETIHQDLKNAQLQRDEVKVATLRLLLSELTYARVAAGQDLSDEQIVSVVQKEIKKRKESITAFRQGDREELAQKEEAEAKVLEHYLPTQMSDEELTKIIESSINEVGANSLSDMGKVMGLVRGRVGQSADPSKISEIVKGKLAPQSK